MKETKKGASAKTRNNNPDAATSQKASNSSQVSYRYNPAQTNRVVSAAISKNGFIRVYCFDKAAQVAVKQFHFKMEDARKALNCAYCFAKEFHAPILKRGMDLLRQCQPIQAVKDAIKAQEEFLAKKNDQQIS